MSETLGPNPGTNRRGLRHNMRRKRLELRTNIFKVAPVGGVPSLQARKGQQVTRPVLGSSIDSKWLWAKPKTLGDRMYNGTAQSYANAVTAGYTTDERSNSTQTWMVSSDRHRNINHKERQESNHSLSAK